MCFQNFMKRFFSIFYGEHAISPDVAFVRCLETEQRSDQRYRYKVFPTHPPAFGSVFYATLRIILTDTIKDLNSFQEHFL
jgi:hypothetical protein